MKKIINFLHASIAILLMTSCEKIISIDYKYNQPAIVIEGNITNLAGPYFVKISKSVSLTETGSYPTIDNAEVLISDNAGNTEILTAQGNGTYTTNLLRGVSGRVYTLTVKVNNQIYTAESTMPNRVPFDSIKVEEVVFAGETERNLIPIYTHPIQKNNNYRFVLSINNKLINQHFVQNDEIQSGVVNTLKLEINDDDVKLIPGDFVSIQMQCIDKNVGLYYTTLALIGDSGPGGGTTPNNPPSNISNGALGVFSAHTVETKTVIIR